jgi:hypothetical protein
MARTPFVVAWQIDRIDSRKLILVQAEHLPEVVERIAQIVHVQRKTLADCARLLWDKVQFWRLAELDLVHVELLPKILRLASIDGASTLGGKSIKNSASAIPAAATWASAPKSFRRDQ